MTTPSRSPAARSKAPASQPNPASTAAPTAALSRYQPKSVPATGTPAPRTRAALSRRAGRAPQHADDTAHDGHRLLPHTRVPARQRQRRDRQDAGVFQQRPGQGRDAGEGGGGHAGGRQEEGEDVGVADGGAAGGGDH